MADSDNWMVQWRSIRLSEDVDQFRACRTDECFDRSITVYYADDRHGGLIEVTVQGRRLEEGMISGLLVP